MKKQFITVFDKSIIGKEKVCMSGGRVGCQIEVNPNDVIALVRGIIENIIVEE